MAVATANKKDEKGNKPKAARYPIGSLTMASAFAKTFSTGSIGFFGQGIDPANGRKYQITAVEIGSNPNKPSAN